MQGQGREGTISLSVEEVDEYDEENEQPEQDCQAEASKIRVVETSFDKPRKSSFRVKKEMRRYRNVFKISNQIEKRSRIELIVDSVSTLK